MSNRPRHRVKLTSPAADCTDEERQMLAGPPWYLVIDDHLPEPDIVERDSARHRARILMLRYALVDDTPLMRRALLAFDATALWCGLHAFERDRRRVVARTGILALHHEATRKIDLWRSFRAGALAELATDAERWRSISPDSDDTARRLSAARAALEVEEALRHEAAFTLQAFEATLAAAERSDGKAQIRRDTTGPLVRVLKDIGLTLDEIAALILESASWGDPPCPDFAAEYSGAAERLARLLAEDEYLSP